MHRHLAHLAALALSGLLAAPAALADHGDHGRREGRHHSQSGVVIYLGGGHGGYLGTIQPRQVERHHGWRDHRYHHQDTWSRQAYRQGYRDGYRAGRYIPHRHHHTHVPPRKMRVPNPNR